MPMVKWGICLIFWSSRIHPCWLLREHWLHGTWIERDSSFPSSLGEAPAQHSGHQSQVHMISKEGFRFPKQSLWHHRFLSSEWQSSRSTGTVVVMAPLRTLRTCRRRSGTQTSFLKTLRCFWNLFWWLILMLSRWTPPWRQPMDCQPQLLWRLNEARDFAFSQHIQSLWNSPDYILIFSVNRYPLLLRKIRFRLSW